MEDEKEKAAQEKSKQDEEEATRKQTEALATPNPNDGISQQKQEGSVDKIAEARVENDRREKILEEEKALQKKKEDFLAEQMVTGRGQVIQQTGTPKPMTSVEYAEAYEKGEVDPFVEDGYK